jgi:hypothetical protein
VALANAGGYVWQAKPLPEPFFKCLSRKVVRSRNTAHWAWLETGLPASISNGRGSLRRCSRRALTRHESSGHRDARTQCPFHVAHKLIAPVFPPQNEAAEPRVEEGTNGRHLSWGRKRVARLRPGGRRASPRSKPPWNASHSAGKGLPSLLGKPFLGPETNASGKRLRPVRPKKLSTQPQRSVDRPWPPTSRPPAHPSLPSTQGVRFAKTEDDHRKVLSARLRPRSSTL